MAAPTMPWVLLVLCSIFSVLSLASATAVDDSLQPRDGAAEPLNCSSKFSGDYYGLGVRLGIYFTWLASWLANTFVEDEIAGALDANSIFLFALLVSIFKGTAVHGLEKLAYIDGLVLMELCAGYLFGILSLWGYRTSHYNREGPKAVRHYGRIGTHFRLLLATAISIYGIWFWVYGIRYDLGHGFNRVTDDAGNPRPPECYPVYVFFFGKLKVLGGIRIFYIVMTVSTTLYYGTMLLAAGAERIRHLLHVLSKEKGHPKRETLNYETGLTKKELNFLFTLNRIFNLFWILFSAVKVELVVVWNHVIQVIGPNGNISYPAQLLPMMIGALSLVRICWLIFKRWRDGDEDCRDENEASTEKTAGASGASQAGLGIMASSPAFADAAHVDGETSVLSKKHLFKRYLIAYLPWLSQFDFWKGRKGHRRLQASVEEGGQRYHDSPLADVQTSYQPSASDGPHKNADLHVRSVASSKDMSPMIDMKSPTSPPTSPMYTV